MKYPKEYLDEIKLRLKVSQVVAKSVQLKKRGKEFIGLSPFKNEKSPSFTVSDEKEFYHCFSTGEHGNIFDFTMKTKSMGFGEAVKILAAEAGMQPYRFTAFDEKKEKKFQTYKDIFKDYVNFFHSELFDRNNFEALNYLKKRGLNKNIIDEFNLGYVPWKNSFYEELKKKYTEEEINLTGLYYKHDKTGKFIDRLNSRVIFPINNLNSDTVALGGRIIKESKLAKYINSPETEFYKKGRMIFNLDKAKLLRSETDQAIIVEGYMDVVSLYAAGIKNVISNSGTALTENQIELIWKFFSNPILCLDGDQSGQNAALKIAERLIPIINENNKIYFSILPEGEDPDDFIKKNGKEEFIKFLSQKKIIQTYIWDIYSSRVEKNNPFAVSKFEKEIKKLCFLIKDETLRKYILEDFLEKIKNLTPNQNFKPFKGNFRKQNLKILNETKKIFNQKNNYSKESLIEFSVLFLVLQFPEIALKKIEEVSELTFSSEENNNLKNDAIIYINKQDGLKELIKNLSINHKKLINEIYTTTNIKNITDKKNEDDLCEILEDLLAQIKELKKIKKIESLEADLINNLDDSSYSELIRLKNQLNTD
jgi:DNA primase